jgi:hypothetical protein
MHYKTIVLQLLEDRPRLHNQLQRERRMLKTVEQLALELKASHEEWRERLRQLRPRSDPAQIASEAMELAIEELQNRLPSESEADNDMFSLEAAMAFLKRPSSGD